MSYESCMRYGYLLASSLYLIYWLLLYYKIKDHNLFRRWLWFFSLQFAILGPISAVVWFGDWWQPETVLGLSWGIEDIILGFANGGLATGVWLVVFEPITKAPVIPAKAGIHVFSNQPKAGHQDGHQGDDGLLKLNKLKLILPLLIYISLATIGLLIFQLNSFWANIFGLSIMTISILIARIDLWRVSIFSGLFMVMSATTIYLAMSLLMPGWIEQTWLFDRLIGINFIGVPVEDYLWYFMVGAGLSLILPNAYAMKLKINLRKRF